jgi:hypothetical protein
MLEREGKMSSHLEEKGYLFISLICFVAVAQNLYGK